MNKYDKIYVPVDDDPKIAPDIKKPFLCNYENGDRSGWRPKLQLEEKENVIVISESDLLDLMQQSIEYAYPTLSREDAFNLLNSKLKS